MVPLVCRAGRLQVRELEDVLGGPDHNTQIIWTSSSNASQKAFDIEDIQHTKG